MIIGFWKMRLDSYKNDYKEDIIDYVTEILLFLVLIIFTPIVLIFDIILLPIYLLAYILKGSDKEWVKKLKNYYFYCTMIS